MRSPKHNPRAHWALLAVGMLAVAVMLVVAGVADHAGAEHAGAAGAAPGVGSALRNGGPVIDATRPHRAGTSLPPQTVALTFDDGPTGWTPQVLDVLERYRVPATFFVIGRNVTEHPGALRRMVRDGDEVGVLTFTNPDLGAVPWWRERLEIDTTQLAIAGATGFTTDLLRLPYSSVPTAITADEVRAIQRAGQYRVVFADVDTRDWARPGIGAIVRAATPVADHGAVVMLHDGGGDRSQTVAALRQLIPALRARGYRFNTVSHAIGVGSAWHDASVEQRLRGSVLTVAVRTSRWFVGWLEVLFIVAGALAVLRTLLLMVFARRHAAGGKPRPLRHPPAPPVTVVVPAYNEAAGIAAAVRSLAASDYPLFEVLVVDDGSTDDTATIVASLGLPAVRLIRQPNAGKPAALNTGITAARYDIVVLVDGDTVFEPGTLRALVAPFANPRVGAVSGNTKVGNRRGLLGRWQHIEYVMGFNLDRRMYDVLQCMPTVPGAIGAFRRPALDQVGRVSNDTLAEDTDLTMAICRAGWRVVYVPDARAWTEAPATLGQLWRQRYRWCYGTLQSMWKHRRAIVQPGAAGRFGRRGLPYLFLFQVLFPVIAPAVDVATVYGLIAGNPLTIGLIWLAFFGIQLIGAWYAFTLDRERRRPLWTLPLQQIIYRQLMYLVVLQSIASALYGIRLRWHKLPRTGQLDAAPQTPG